MPKEKADIEYQTVTMRIPKEMYAAYKRIMREKGSIVTYDIRRYMNSVIEEEEARKEKN